MSGLFKSSDINEVKFLEDISGLYWQKRQAVTIDGQTWNAYVNPRNKRLVIVTTGNDYPTLHAAYVLTCRSCQRPIMSKKLYNRKEFNGHKGSEPVFDGHIHHGNVSTDRRIRKLLRGMFYKPR